MIYCIIPPFFPNRAPSSPDGKVLVDISGPRLSAFSGDAALSSLGERFPISVKALATGRQALSETIPQIFARFLWRDLMPSDNKGIRRYSCSRGWPRGRSAERELGWHD